MEGFGCKTASCEKPPSGDLGKQCKNDNLKSLQAQPSTPLTAKEILRMDPDNDLFSMYRRDMDRAVTEGTETAVSLRYIALALITIAKAMSGAQCGN